MNYLKQLNSFYKLLPVTNLSAGAQSLYFCLLHINNSCNWREEFSVANSTLMGLTSLSKTALYRVRNELIDQKLIVFKNGINQKQSGTYTIVNLTTGTANETLDETARETADKIISKNETADETPDETLDETLNETNNKLNETKLNETENTVDGKLNNIIKYYEANIALVLPATFPLLEEISEKFDEKLVFKAIDIACSKNIRNLSYVNGILQDWDRRGYKRVSDIQNQKQGKPTSSSIKDEFLRRHKNE